jgi:hypothetical protein
MISRKFGALITGVALLLPACEQACPTQPTRCSSSATLTFVLEDGIPEAYDLRIRIRENGVDEEDRCLLIAPLPSDWPRHGLTATCAKNSVSLYIQPVLESHCDPNVVPTPDGIEVGAECTTTVTRHELVLHRGSQPETIEIEAIRGEESFAPLTVTPQYADYYPDGEHCSAHCPVAAEQRSFAALTQPAGGTAGTGAASSLEHR